MNMLRPEALKHLHPGWFSVVMGLGGLALAWTRAARSMGEVAGAAALVLAALAALVFLALLALSWWRWLKQPQALAADLAHPVRHAFVAALPISMMLLCGLAVSVLGQTGAWVAALWWPASLMHFGAAVWLLSRWLGGARAGGWAQITPALFLPAVGNMVAPLAGVPLGAGPWVAAQFGMGLLLWLALLALLLARLAVHGVWTQRLLPLTFITIAPPALAGMAALQLGWPRQLAWMAWGVALLLTVWSMGAMPRILAQPVSITSWAMAFPLSAFAALSLQLAGMDAGALGTLAQLALALACLAVVSLALATYKGLRNGTMLAPEQVALNAASSE